MGSTSYTYGKALCQLATQYRFRVCEGDLSKTTYRNKNRSQCIAGVSPGNSWNLEMSQPRGPDSLLRSALLSPILLNSVGEFS